MKKVKIRYRENSNGTSSIRLNYFHGYENVKDKKKAKRSIKTLPFHLVTNPVTKEDIKLNESYKKEAHKIAESWEKSLLLSESFLKDNSFTKNTMFKLDSKIPEGPVTQKWTNHKGKIDLVSPANKRLIDIIVVGTGLAGASASATLAELGYNVKTFCFQDSPRRAHSIAAQGGINAAKNYQGDGDSTYRLFYDTIKGGDYRSREANVHRLAEVSTNIIDQCVAQGVPFARDYGGLLDNRSFGGVLVSRTFYAKGQTGQQLLLGAYSAMNRQIGRGKIKMYNRHEMMDVVLVDGKARGIIARNLVDGKIERHGAHAVVIASGGYGNVFFLSTNAMGSNVSAGWKIHKKGAYFANPCFTQIHPTCIPVSGDHQSKLTLMSESLRNDGRIWVPKKI
jgi:succinate dehydrogenase / fumarate reductase flavoprotein subunit